MKGVKGGRGEKKRREVKGEKGEMEGREKGVERGSGRMDRRGRRTV